MDARSLIVGVIGHVDHGKTALVRSLTGIETDRLPEEQRRGMSIALGFAHFSAGGAVVDLIDMPGHERFIRAMIAGATGIRAVMLVVSANEGIKPQTVEHVEIAALLGVREAIIVVSKTDLASPEPVGARAALLAAEFGFRAPPPFPVCSTTGAGIAALKQALGELAGRSAPAADHGLPYLPIDRAFSLVGHGTVVTGTLRAGSIAAGDELELTGDSRRLKVRGLQVRGLGTESARPGRRVALNLRNIDKTAARNGLALAVPGLLRASEWLTVELRAAPSGMPLGSGTVARMLYGASETGATVRLLDRATLPPGQSGFVQLRCVPRVAIPVGEAVILRAASPPRVLAGGRVLDSAAQRLRRGDPDALAWCATLATATPDAIIAAALSRAGERGRPVVELVRLLARSASFTEAALQRCGAVRAGDLAIDQAAFTRVRDTVLQTLHAHPDGVSPRVLRDALPACGAEVLRAVLAELARRGLIENLGRIRLIRVERDAARRFAEADIAARLAEGFRRAGLTPPTERPADLASKRALDALVRSGVLVRATDHGQKRDVLFHREAVDGARLRLRPLLVDGPGVLVSDAGAALGISRKYCIPLLEYFDAIQFTRRVGDRRRLREP